MLLIDNRGTKYILKTDLTWTYRRFTWSGKHPCFPSTAPAHYTHDIILMLQKALRWQVSSYRVIFQSNYSATCNNPGQNTAASICPVILGSKLFCIGTSHIPWPASFVTGGHFILLLYVVGPHMSNLLVCFNQLRFQPGQAHVFAFYTPFFPG